MQHRFLFSERLPPSVMWVVEYDNGPAFPLPSAFSEKAENGSKIIKSKNN